MKPLVYIAGPITLPDPFVNVHHAAIVNRGLLADGLVTPFMPQWSVLAAMITPDVSYTQWLAYDLEIIDRCDALLRLDGKSSGAEVEVEHAQNRGIPVFKVHGTSGIARTLVDLYDWARVWAEDHAAVPS